MSDSNVGKVSVVVTTRNEERNIERCLESIAAQTWKNIEIVVVDNGSTDRTKELALKYTVHVHDKGPERSAQRNFGIATLSTGEFAMFIDADMILSPQLIEACVSEMDAPEVSALHIEEVVLGRGALASIRRFERSFYSGTVVDGVRFFRRDQFVSIGGFDENLPPGPEDWDIDKRFKAIGVVRMVPPFGRACKWEMDTFVNTRGVSHVETFVGIYHNEDEQSLGRYLSKKGYYSGSMTAYTEKWPGDKDIKKQLGIPYRFFGVFVEHGKWRRCLQQPLLTIGMLSLRLLVGLTFIRRRR